MRPDRVDVRFFWPCPPADGAFLDQRTADPQVEERMKTKKRVASLATGLGCGLLLVWLAGCAGGEVEEESGLDTGGEAEMVAAREVPAALDAEQQACAQDLVDLEGRILSVAGEARAAIKCRSADDCAVIDLSLSCMAMCPSAVPASQVEATHERLASMEESCAAPRDCSMHPSCPPIERAACVRGRCVPDVSAWINR
jgi:hypothetical protein